MATSSPSVAVRLKANVQLALFVLLAYGISWGMWAPLLVKDAEAFPGVASWLYYGGVVGPAVAAVCLSKLEGPASLGTLWRFSTTCRVSWRWYGLALLLPFAIRGASLLVFRAFQGPVEISWRPIATFLPFAALVLPLVALEELGWRGFALPRLQERHSPLAASLVVGLIWGVWHLPLAWASTGFQASDRPVVYMLRFVATILPISCLATWVFNGTGGSVILASLYHFSVDLSETILVLPDRIGTWVLWISTALSSVVVLLIWRWVAKWTVRATV